MFSTATKVIVIAFAFCATACGHYQLGHGNRTLPGGYDRVSVPMFLNKTHEVGIETYFTEALRLEFERSDLAKVVDRKDAQVVLEGVITHLSIVPTLQAQPDSSDLLTPDPINPATGQPYPDPKALRAGGEPEKTFNPLPKHTVLNKQYSVTLTVSVSARRASDHSILWSGNFTSTRPYNGPLLGTPTLLDGTPGINTAAPLYNQVARQDTIARLAKDMMAEAHDRITENF